MLKDWFRECLLQEDLGPANRFQELRARIESDFPGAKTYEFLPIAALEATEEEFQTLLDQEAAAEYVIRPRFAIEYYEPVLNALNALRSQTGHQMFQFPLLIQAGGQLPHDAWEGGVWPARAGYPSMPSDKIEFDPSLRYRVTPGLMPVINMSLGKGDLEYLGGGDPIVLAQAAVGETHLIVVAAGNLGQDASHAWARFDTVLSVGATEDVGGRRLAVDSAVSCEGEERSGPDVVAYGGPPDGFKWNVGTSFAAPRVASLATVCQAAFAQVHRIRLQACGIPDVGIPLIGMGIIDMDREGVRPRTDLPGLPVLGVNEQALKEAFDQLRAMDVDMRFEVNPAMLRSVIIDSAKKMNGYDEGEVGAGFVSLGGLIEHLSELDLATLVKRCAHTEVDGTWTDVELSDEAIAVLEQVRPFDSEGLHKLAQVMQDAKPLWVYDVENHQTPFVSNAGIPMDQYDAFAAKTRAKMTQSKGHADAVMWADP